MLGVIKVSGWDLHLTGQTSAKTVTALAAPASRAPEQQASGVTSRWSAESPSWQNARGRPRKRYFLRGGDKARFSLVYIEVFSSVASQRRGTVCEVGVSDLLDLRSSQTAEAGGGVAVVDCRGRGGQTASSSTLSETCDLCVTFRGSFQKLWKIENFLDSSSQIK